MDNKLDLTFAKMINEKNKHDRMDAEIDRQRKLRNSIRKRKVLRQKLFCTVALGALTTVMAFSATKTQAMQNIKNNIVADDIASLYGNGITKDDIKRTADHKGYYYEMGDIADNIIETQSHDYVFYISALTIINSSSLNDSDKVRNLDKLVSQMKSNISRYEGEFNFNCNSWYSFLEENNFYSYGMDYVEAKNNFMNYMTNMFDTDNNEMGMYR